MNDDDMAVCCNHCGEELPSSVIHSAWIKVARDMNRQLNHMRALQSGNVTTNRDGSFLDDGTPVTDEIMEAWGWRSQDDVWVWEPEDG
ncbi:MAG: hypothetical protein OEV86_15095 [Candidatus Krumholzibacteria bacterium]|nr:hypothetical protein [Candidatus Krumholzibacteria bacterium]